MLINECGADRVMDEIDITSTIWTAGRETSVITINKTNMNILNIKKGDILSVHIKVAKRHSLGKLQDGTEKEGEQK